MQFYSFNEFSIGTLTINRLKNRILVQGHYGAAFQPTVILAHVDQRFEVADSRGGIRDRIELTGCSQTVFSNRWINDQKALSKASILAFNGSPPPNSPGDPSLRITR